ncbi:MAG: hypothetical protein FJW85_00290 [Actinobacteria bacterium]|nr:hypothetical protein [Actinomycetota bacterium]
MAVGRERPAVSLLVGAGVAAIEGLALTVYAVYIAVQVARLGITGPAEVSNPVAVTLEIAIFGLLGVALILAARGLWRSRRWARSMLVVGQFIALVVGVPLVTAEEGPQRGAGIVLVCLAVAGLVAAFWPSTTTAIESGESAQRHLSSPDA